MAFGFKLPATGSANQDTGTASSGVKIPLPAFLAQQSAIQQMKTLGAMFLLLLLLIAALVYHDNRESTHGTAYVSAAGEMRHLCSTSGADFIGRRNCGCHCSGFA